MQGIEWLILILAILFLLFGAKRITGLARSLGKAKGEFEIGQREAIKELKKMEIKEAEKTISSMAESDIVKAAKDLGIDTKEKTDEELKEEILKILGEK